MKMKTLSFSLIVLLLFSSVLAACGTKGQTSASGEEEQNTVKKSDSEVLSVNEEKDVYLVAESMKDIIKEKQGKYAGTKYNKAIIHKTLNENSFQDKDSFQIYSILLTLLAEGKNYKPYYDDYRNFKPDIETKISKMPCDFISIDIEHDEQKQLKASAEEGDGEFKTVSTTGNFHQIPETERRRLWIDWWNWSNSNWNNVWNEQQSKKNDLFDIHSELNHLAYDEKSRLIEASNYLQSTEQISYHTWTEIDSLINQRYNMIKKYNNDTYEELKKELDTKAENLKTAIKTKGDEMKAKYKN